MGMDSKVIWFKDERGNKFTIYRQTVEDLGNSKVRSWQKLELPKAVRSKDGMTKSIKSLEEFDCASHTNRTITSASYDDTGASLGDRSYAQSAETNWKPIIPETVGELQLAVVCTEAGYKVEHTFE